MSTNELAALLGSKYTPTTHDYCLSNRRSSIEKLQQGWLAAGEFTNHGEVMVVLSRKRPEPAAPKPTTLISRATSALRGK